MPNEIEYSLQELADLADVTPRTIRYYIVQGLLPSPEGAGPAARYGDRHLRRLRLVRQLQRRHMPLADIRRRLEGLDDDQVEHLQATNDLTDDEPAHAAESAIDYIRSVLRERRVLAEGSPPAASRPLAMSRASLDALTMSDLLADEIAGAPGPAHEPAPAPGPAHEPAPQPMTPSSPTAPSPSTAPATAPVQTPDRSQWDRVTLAPDIELHVRRPLSRLQNKRVDRLIVIARQLLEEE